jgi:hypothetical protein
MVSRLPQAVCRVTHQRPRRLGRSPRVGRLGEDQDQVNGAELGAECILADRGGGVAAPTPKHGADGGMADGHVARIGDGQNVVAPRRTRLGDSVDFETELEGLRHGVGRKMRVAAGGSVARAPAQVPPHVHEGHRPGCAVAVLEECGAAGGIDFRAGSFVAQQIVCGREAGFKKGRGQRAHRAH